MTRITFLLIFVFCCISSFKGQENLEEIIIPLEISIEKNKNADKEWLLQKVFKHSFLQEAEYPQGTTPFFKYVDTTIVAEKISRAKIELPCRNDTIILEDIPEDEYGYYATYQYIGRLDVLNAYIIHVYSGEASNFHLIDMDSGEELFYFNLLEFSPDGHYLITGDYEGARIDTFQISIYAIDNKKLKPVAYLYYNDWIYAGNGMRDALWSTGDKIYIPFTTFDDRENISYFKIEVDRNKL